MARTANAAQSSSGAKQTAMAAPEATTRLRPVRLTPQRPHHTPFGTLQPLGQATHARMRLRHLIASSSAIATLSLEEVADRIGKLNLLTAAAAARHSTVLPGSVIISRHDGRAAPIRRRGSRSTPRPSDARRLWLFECCG